VVKKLNQKGHKGITKLHKVKKNQNMYNNYQSNLIKIIDEIKEAGAVTKNERIIVVATGR